MHAALSAGARKGGVLPQTDARVTPLASRQSTPAGSITLTPPVTETENDPVDDDVVALR